jgi:hypothetical protein
MHLQCPCCGEQFPVEAGFADADGKRLAGLLAGLDPRLGKAVLNYLRLFSPPKRGLRMIKAIRLVEDLVALMEPGQVQRDARTNDFKPAPARLWTAGIERMLLTRDQLQLPLENHNYLRAVVWGLASDPAQAQAAVPVRTRSASTTVQQDMQEKIGRIASDVQLGLITKEEGEHRIQALRGGSAHGTATA